MVITPSMLDADCLAILTRAAQYQQDLFAVLRVLYYTGCREQEALDRNRWVELPGSIYSLQPQKHNNVRLIPSSVLPKPFISWINAKGYPSSLSSANNLRRATRMFSAYPNATCGDKGISSHRWRHNRIKQLSISGKTVDEIKVIMGLTSSSIVSGYINSVIEA